MNKSVKKRYITWLLLAVNALCTFLNVPNEVSASNTWVSFHHGYKFDVNDLKVTGGVTIFVF